MLFETSIGLSKVSSKLSVVSRNKNQKLSAAGAHHIATNYMQIEDTLLKLEQQCKMHGAFDIVVSWIHSTAPDASYKIAKLLSEKTNSLEFYDVLGSLKKCILLL